MTLLHRASFLAALALNLAAAPAALAASETKASEPPATEVPPAPVLNGPTLAALQLGLPLLGGWILRSTLPRDLVYRVNPSIFGNGSGEFRPATIPLLGLNSYLLVPGYALLGQASDAGEQQAITMLISGAGALIAYQAAGQPPFSSGLSDTQLDQARINGALIGMGAGFLVGQIRSACDVWSRADAMQRAHDQALSRMASAQADLAHMSIAARSPEIDTAIGSMINLAVPLLAFPVGSVLARQDSLLWGSTAAIVTAPICSGTIHALNQDWEPAIRRTLLGPVWIVGGALAGFGAGLVYSILTPMIPHSGLALQEAAVGMQVGALATAVWWSVDSAREAAERAQARNVAASSGTTSPATVGQAAPGI